MPSYSITPTERGIVAEANGVRAHLPADADAFANAIQPISDLTEAGNQLTATHKDEAIGPALLSSTYGKSALAAVAVSYGAALQSKRDRQAALADIMQPVAAADEHLWPEWRAIHRGLDRAEQARRINAASLSEAAALATAPALAGLDDQLAELARERFLALNVVERLGIAGGYPAMPSLKGELLATGIDADAVRKAGEAAVQSIRDRQAASERDETTVRGLIGFLAAAFNVSPEEILQRVTP